MLKVRGKTAGDVDKGSQVDMMFDFETGPYSKSEKKQLGVI